MAIRQTGTTSNQTPRITELGTMAFQNHNSPIIGSRAIQETNISNTRPALHADFVNSRKLPQGVGFLRRSLGTYVDKSGYIKNVAYGTPRFEYDDNSQSKGLLVEKGATNGLSCNVNLSNFASFAPTTSVVQNTYGILSPDGETTSYVMVPTSTNNDSLWLDRYQGFTGSNRYQTFSVFVKPIPGSEVNGAYLWVAAVNNAAADNFNSYAYFDFESLTCTYVTDNGASAGTTRGTIEQYSHGWYRVAISYYGGGTSGAIFRIGGFRNASRTWAVTTANEGNGMCIWGGQNESSYFPTSLVSTTATAANQLARASERCQVLANDLYKFINEKEMTIVMEYQHKYLGNYDSTTKQQLLYLLGNSNSNQVQIGINNYANPQDYHNIIDDSGQDRGTFRSDSENDGKIHRIALAASSNSSLASFYKDGKKISKSSGSVNAGFIDFSLFTDMWIGSQGSFNNEFNGYIRKLSIYRSRLSDNELQELTK